MLSFLHNKQNLMDFFTFTLFKDEEHKIIF